MTKIPKIPKYGKSSSTIPSVPVPVFHRISQIMNNGKVNPLFPKPVFCVQSKGLRLGLSKCIVEGGLISIEVKALDPAGQNIAMLEATELDLTKYTKDD